MNSSHAWNIPGKPLHRREVWQACLLLAIAVCLIHSRGLIGSHLAGEADMLRSGYPLRYHFWSMVERGELPTWTPRLMGGYPLIVEEEVIPFFAPEWVFGVARTPAAYNWMLAFTFWIAGVGAYFLARGLGISVLGAWLVALVTLLGAPLVARVAAGHNAHLFGRTLIIWQLIAILWLARKPGWWSALGLGLVFGQMMLIGVGIYQMTLYTGLVSVLFGLYLLAFQLDRSQRARFLAWGMVAVLIGLGLGAAMTAISFDVVMQGNRQEGLSQADLNHGALPLFMMSGYVLPHTFDDPTITDYAWPEFALYVGTATVLLAAYAVRQRWAEPIVKWWALVVLLFLWLSLGSAAGLYQLFIDFVPGYTLFRNPSRHAMVAGLGITILAGYGWDALLRSGQCARETRRVSPYLVGILAALVVVWAVSRYQVPTGESSFEVLPQRLLRAVIWFAAILVSFGLAFQVYRARPQRVTALLLLGVVVFDVGLYAYPIIYRHASPITLSYVTQENFPVSEGRGVAFFEDDSVSDWGQVNATAESGLLFLNTYSSVMPGRLINVVNLLAGRPPDTYQENQIILDALERPELLDLFAIQWLIMPADRALPDDPSLVEGRVLGEVRRVENRDAFPFAFVAPHVETVSSSDQSLDWLAHTRRDLRQYAVVEGDIPPAQDCPSRQVTDEQLTNVHLAGGDLRFQIDAPQAGMLIINQNYQRGWQGWINGEETNVYPANHRWLSVYLPCAGRYEVHLRYLPPSLIIGLIVSGTTLGLVVVVSLFRLIKWRSRGNQTAHAS